MLGIEKCSLALPIPPGYFGKISFVKISFGKAMVQQEFGMSTTPAK